jgi:hypothetical protein
MKDKENDIIYNANDIQDYLAGKLTPLQMHSMEKAALDDPFLAEAIEGYEELSHENWKDQLAALKNEFATEKHQAKIIALPKQKNNNWWKVAAAILLLGGTATIAYLMVNKNTNQDIAQKVEPAAKIPPADTIRAAGNVESALATTTQQALPQPKLNTTDSKEYYTTTNSNGAISSADENVRSDSAFLYTPGKSEAKAGNKQIEDVVSNNDRKESNNNAVATNTAPPSVVYSNNSVSNEKNAGENKYYNYNSNAGRSSNGIVSLPQFQKAKTAADKDLFAADLKKETQLSRNFRAQVVGPDNSPLPFANISIKSENFGTYADAKGNFRLISSDSLLTVEVKAAGYQPRFYTLQSFVQQNKIVLAEEDAASRYKTISGNSNFAKAKTSRRATLLKDSLVNVEPADGWDNYSTYVDNNIEIPDDILKKDIHGQVELSFDVSANGTISNIKVDKSLCDNCDELAKRLIEQGPQWKVKKGKKGKGKVTVQF